MTTYGFNLSLDEQELWAIKESMEFYVTAEAMELRNKNPHLVKYFADIKLNELLASGKLYKEMQLDSSNNFGQATLQNSLTSQSNETLFAIIVKRLVSNPQLLALAETPVRDMFTEHPTLEHVILDCIMECLNDSNARISLECKELLGNDASRKHFCNLIGKELYRINTQSHLT